MDDNNKQQWQQQMPAQAPTRMAQVPTTATTSNASTTNNSTSNTDNAATMPTMAKPQPCHVPSASILTKWQ